ncbi:hypothetical protein THAOC_26671, partial [Thalassiosira oceanica]
RPRRAARQRRAVDVRQHREELLVVRAFPTDDVAGRVTDDGRAGEGGEEGPATAAPRGGRPRARARGDGGASPLPVCVCLFTIC